MNIKRLVLCIVITMVFSFGLGTISVLADETQMNKELHISELGNDSEVQLIAATSDTEEVSLIEEEITETIKNDTVSNSEELKVADTDLNTPVDTKTPAVEESVDTSKSKVTNQPLTKDSEDKAVLGTSKEFKQESDKVNEEKKVVTNKAKANAKANTNAKASTTKTTTTVKEKTPVKKVKAATTPEVKYSKSELRLLSALVYAEASNQSYKGKLAVANIVLNREKSSVFYHVNSVKEVIYDSKWSIQFSVIKKNSSGSSPFTKALDIYDNLDSKSSGVRENMEEAIKAAKSALSGNNNIGSYLYFSRTSSYLKSKYKNHIIIGDHIFYNTK